MNNALDKLDLLIIELVNKAYPNDDGSMRLLTAMLVDEAVKERIERRQTTTANTATTVRIEGGGDEREGA